MFLIFMTENIILNKLPKTLSILHLKTLNAKKMSPTP